MTKVLLINCPTSFIDSKTAALQPPMGLLYIKEYIHQQNSTIDIKILDSVLLGFGISQTSDYVKEFNPEIVGINVQSPLFSIAKTLISEIKKDKNLIVIGGPHPTLQPEDSLKFTSADIAVIGDGEISFNEVINAYISHKDMSEISGICYRKQNEIIKTTIRPIEEEIDTLPFPFSDKSTVISYNEVDNDNLIGFIVSSRGCPQDCIYCSSPVICNRHWRKRSIGNLMQEILFYHKEFGIKEIHFLDDNFTVNINRLKEYCQLIDPLQLKWRALSRVGLSHDILSLMKSSGCYRLSFGIESGSEEILKRIKKRISLKNADETLRSCFELGISSKIFFIIGFPFERIEHIVSTINVAVEWVKKYGVDVAFNIAKPYVGSELNEYTESIINFKMIQADISLSEHEKKLIEKFGDLPSVSINPNFSVRDLICFIEAAYSAISKCEYVNSKYLLSLRGTI